MLRPVLLGLPLAIAIAGAALAHSGATGIVKERMEAMEDLGADMKTIAAMLRGKAAYDQAGAIRAANDIAAHAEAIPGLFPDGSTDHPSEARETIWRDWDRFTGLASDLRQAADRMAADAEATLSEPFQQAFADAGRTCRDCHAAFRLKK